MGEKNRVFAYDEDAIEEALFAADVDFANVCRVGNEMRLSINGGQEWGELGISEKDHAEIVRIFGRAPDRVLETDHGDFWFWSG